MGRRHLLPHDAGGRSTRILSIGAGAVGGTVASRLEGAGLDPLVVDANEEHVAVLNEPGLEVNGRRTKLRALAPDDLPDEHHDIVLLAVRSDATEDALKLAKTGDVVSLQNGLNEDKIAAIVGPQRTIGCVVGFGATWIGPGRISLDAEGPLTIGRLDGSTDGVLEQTREVLNHAFPTSITDNIRGALWAKMLVNSVTVLGALAGMLTGDLLRAPRSRHVAGAIVAEGIAVATAERVALGRVFGVDAYEWDERGDDALRGFGERFGAIKSVTWRDFELGRRTEIDAVTGEIVGRAERNHVAVPISAKVYEMLREIETGGRVSAPTNLDTIVA